MEIVIVLLIVLAIAILLLWSWTEKQEGPWDFSSGRSGVIDLGKKSDTRKTQVVVHVWEDDRTTVTREPR